MGASSVVKKVQEEKEGGTEISSLHRLVLAKIYGPLRDPREWGGKGVASPLLLLSCVLTLQRRVRRGLWDARELSRRRLKWEKESERLGMGGTRIPYPSEERGYLLRGQSENTGWRKLKTQLS